MRYSLRFGATRKIKTGIINTSMSLVLLASGITGALPLVFGQSAFAASSITVSPGSLNGWYFYNDQDDSVQTSDANHGFVNGPSTTPAGSGSVHLTKTSSDKYGIATNQFANTKLSDISNLSYSTYRVSGTAAQVPSLGFDVDSDATDADNSYQGRLTYEPYFTHTVDTATWQTWDTQDDAGTGNWWFSHATLSGGAASLCTQGNPCTWSELLTDYPDAKISGRFILRTNGADTEAFSGNVDNLTLNSTTYDFENTPTLVAEDFDTWDNSPSFKGFNVGFAAQNFGSVTAATVNVTRTDGSHVTKTAGPDMLNYLSNTTALTQASAPFVVTPGTDDGETSDSWWSGQTYTGLTTSAKWTADTMPTSVTITVTGDNGTLSATTNNFLEGDASHPTYLSILPPTAPDAPTSTMFKKVVAGVTTTYQCGTTVNSVFDNKLQFVWTDPSGSIVSHRTKVTYPDGTNDTFYTSSRNLWIDGINAGRNVGFGQHGNGVYSFAVQAENSAGLWSPAATCDLSYDTHSPTANFTGTVPQYVNDDFTISGVANDNVKLKDVLFDVRDSNGWVAGCVSGTLNKNYTNDQKDAAPTCTINTANLVDGQTYTLRIHASDYAGYGGGESRQITIDRTGPVVSINNPAGDMVTKDTNVPVNVTVTDDHALNTLSVYLTDVAGNYINTCTSASNLDTYPAWITSYTTDCSLNLAGFSDGTYKLIAKSQDRAGNYSNTATRLITIDRTAPTATIDAYTGTNTTPTLTGTVSEPTAVLKIKIDNGTEATAANNGDGTWTYTLPSALTVGSHNVSLTAEDEAGNKFEVSANATVEAPHASPQGLKNSNGNGNSNNAPGHQSTVTITPNNDGHVLGASTESNSDGNVLGASTDKSKLPTVNFANTGNTQKNKNANAFLGLGWWWLAVVAAFAFFWFLFAARRSESK